MNSIDGKRKNRSLSCSSSISDNESWTKSFWEKEMGRFTRPRPLTRRAFTEEVTRNDMPWEFNPEYDHYKQLSVMLLPAEEALHIAMNRFPLPNSVVGEEDRHNLWPANLCTSHEKSEVHLAQKSTETILDRSHSAGSYTEMDSEDEKSEVHLSQKSTETIFDRSHSAGSYTERDSEERPDAQVHQTADLSPRSARINEPRAKCPIELSFRSFIVCKFCC